MPTTTTATGSLPKFTTHPHLDDMFPVIADAPVASKAEFYILPDTLRNWPYEYVVNPYYRAARAESGAWLESFQLFTPVAQKAFNKGDFSLFTALIYPRATHYDLRSGCDLMNIFFALDEHTDVLNTEGVREHCEATMDAILHPEKPRPEGEPIIGEITRQFWKRASAAVPQATKERFIKTWRSYLDSVVLQAQRREQSRYICTIEEYVTARRDNIGCPPSYLFLEVSLGLDIPHHVMEHPSIVGLNRDATDMTWLTNDMCSYKKEVLAGDADYNIITVIMKNNNTDLGGAVKWISDTYDGVAEHFLRVRDDVLSKRGFPSFNKELDRQVATYIDGLGQWVRGQDEWSFASARYFGDEGLEVRKTRRVTIA